MKKGFLDRIQGKWREVAAHQFTAAKGASDVFGAKIDDAQRLTENARLTERDGPTPSV